MDFSIFLIHRFEEDLKLADGNVNAAMVSSMRTTLTAISSSALTDCAGFMALVFMQNQIGADIGIVLCKGVVFSLLISMTFLPCAILATYPLGKRKHRVLMPSLEKLSNPLIKYRFVFLAVVIAALIPGIIGSQNQQYYYTSDKFMPDDTKPIIATEKIGDIFGATDTVHVLFDKTLSSREPAAAADIKALKSVRDVTAYSDSAAATVPDTFIPDELKDMYIGDTHRRFTVTLERGMDNDTLFAAIDDIRAIAKAHFGEDSYVTGAYASAADMASTADVDNMMVEVISIVFIFVILLIAFRSVLIPVFLVLVIKAAIYINVGYDFYFGEDMIFLTPVLVNSIQLGATVDYAILFTSRYVEFRRDAADAKEAIRQTIAAASRPMLTSVLTFYFATLSITMISSIKATREISSVVGRGALISFVVIMFALPALFILFDKPLRATTLSLRKKKDRG
jgi:predicted RND superfamily exporter protein